MEPSRSITTLVGGEYGCRVGSEGHGKASKLTYRRFRFDSSPLWPEISSGPLRKLSLDEWFDGRK